MTRAAFTTAISLLLFCSTAYSMSPLLGGKSERAVDDHAHQLASFAVGEIGQRANIADLSLVRVAKLSTQVVAGIKYYFELEAKDKAGNTRHYEAQVWEKPGGYDNGANVELLNYKEAGQQASSVATAAAGGGEWEAAALSAVAQINTRSNSLVPYELVTVEASSPLAGGAAELRLKLRRGDKHEAMDVRVEPRDGGRFALAHFAPAN